MNALLTTLTMIVIVLFLLAGFKFHIQIGRWSATFSVNLKTKKENSSPDLKGEIPCRNQSKR